MNPILRLSYLDAMGIQQYVARFPLPGAKPSLLLTVVQTGIQDSTEPLTQTQAMTAAPPERVVFATDTHHRAQEDLPKPAPGFLRPAITTTKTLHQPYHCQIAYWHINDLLVIAEVPRMDNAILALLKDILFAIQRNNLPAPELFQWPVGKIADKSLASAQDYFQGLLDQGLLKKAGLRQILLFGVCPLQLIGQGDSEVRDQRYHDWPIVALPDLRHMLEQPASKAEAWKKLLPLVPVA